MPTHLDPALQNLSSNVRRELEMELSYGPRGGHFTEIIMPLNAGLLDRQRQIDALKSRLAHYELRLICGDKAHYDEHGHLAFPRYEPS